VDAGRSSSNQYDNGLERGWPLLFQMRNVNKAVKLLTEAFPKRRQVGERQRSSAKVLEMFTRIVNKGQEMATVQKLSQVEMKCRVRKGRTKLCERESTMN